MNYKYYKITGGKFVERYEEIVNQRAESIRALNELCSEVGAESASEFSRGGLAFFNFSKEPDRKIWKCALNGYMPKVSTKEGKAISKKISSMPEIISTDDALECIGLKGLRVFGESTGMGVRVHSATFCGKLPERTFFIKVPQCEENPYVPKDKDMVECKEWEMLKFMDE